MTPATKLLTFLLCAAPAAQIQAQALDGRYKLTETAQCIPGADDGILRIEDDILYGAEARCRMTNPLDVTDMDATLYDMVCLGEGTGWQERALLMRAATGGLILVWDGYAFEYEACPAPPKRPTPRPEGSAPDLPVSMSADPAMRPRPRPLTTRD
ncbi:MAG: hypothetical protein AAGB05_01415 [Pseudomonadota bacterium]